MKDAIDGWSKCEVKGSKEACLAPWKRRVLSKGGRLVLIKAVILSIPTYYLSVFKISVGIANRIERIQRSFLWGDGVIKRKLHAVGWSEVCKRKGKGGLGIGRILDKNKVMLANWIWRFGKEDKALWRRVICSKYGMEEESLCWQRQMSNNDSCFVRSVGSLRKDLG
ncbi:hypothetical protein Ddye_011825 [Dipteronia dyeriana]|uniref:Uncharacterized protein n=1 Tax=Dipteronia dyeriana TaxID=168575 RepID=A0AAE0CHN5_9ROSI|nr:hypothetical protein Ddye_011825 [Dipteronia dyeriana]